MMNEKIKQDNNTGNHNTGNHNTGNHNTGDWNTGYCNTGNWNNGDRNTGYYNTGNWNNGYCNAGDRNTGYRNTGNWNNGNYNTGNWNNGDRNTGYCNTVTPENTLIFNKLAKFSDWENAEKPIWMYFELTEWIYSDDMTQTEKELHPTYKTTGGYLRTYHFREAALNSWNTADHKDKMKTYDLPNFDANIAQEIFGIDFKDYLSNEQDKSKLDDSKKSEIINLNGKRYKLITDDE